MIRSLLGRVVDELAPGDMDRDLAIAMLARAIEAEIPADGVLEVELEHGGAPLVVEPRELRHVADVALSSYGARLARRGLTA